MEDSPEPHPSKITITIQTFQNIPSEFVSSLIFATCLYRDTDFGTSKKSVLIDDPIIVSNHEFEIELGSNVAEELDNLITNPVIMKIFQEQNQNAALFLQTENENEAGVMMEELQSIPSIESAISLYEALTGDVVEKKEISIVATKKKSKEKTKVAKEKKSSKEKVKKGSLKDSKGSKKSSKASSKGSKKGRSTESVKTKSKEDKSTTEGKVIESGVCVLDLLPLVLGKQCFSQFVSLITSQQHYDDRMKRHCAEPGILVKVTLDNPFSFECKPNFLSFTVESIYNLPLTMTKDMQYKVCVLLPSINEIRHPVVLDNGEWTENKPKEYLEWPLLPKAFWNQTNYRLDHNIESVKNQIENVELKDILKAEQPRIQFNTIKRNLLLKESFLGLSDQVKKFKKIVVELYIVKPNKPTEYLHLMTVLELSKLLFPGVSKLRIAAPLTTFHYKEALTVGGLPDSFFFPTPPPVIPKEEKKEEKGQKSPKKDKKDAKSSKGSKKDKKSDKSKGSKKKNKAEVEEKKPPIDPALLPPVKIVDEDNKPTFIVIDIELTQPLMERRSLDDLHEELRRMVQEKIDKPRMVVDLQLSVKLYQNTIKEIVGKANEYYREYIKLKEKCKCGEKIDFLTYLRRLGVYQKFVSAITDNATRMAQFIMQINMEEQTYPRLQTFAEKMFMWLMTELNVVLHQLDMTKCEAVEYKNSMESLLFFAREATELGDIRLAEKYYLERLYHDPENPDYWFDFAVFHLHMRNQETAFMCVLKALGKNPYHRNSLLLSGILFTERRRIKEAELCLLTVMAQEPKWVEGWTVLYLFYKEMKNENGMDFALEMALKYLDESLSTLNCYSMSEDFAWSSSICSQTLAFKVSVLLVKMRVLSWAENALIEEMNQTGLVHYMLAVICYYNKQFQHAIEHLEKARIFHGSDYAVVSLTGHCYFALKQNEKALQEYIHVLTSFDRPDDMHLLYLNCAEITGDLQQARKLLLTACKNHPTPHSWRQCGIAYFRLNDFVSAEECFSESILLDSSSPDSWGYLTLINLKLGRMSEAEICYSLALKNNLENEYLKKEIRKQFEKFK